MAFTIDLKIPILLMLILFQNLRFMNYLIKFVVTCSITLLGFSSLTADSLKETSYSRDDLHLPYPLVFVHGYNATIDSWNSPKNKTWTFFEGHMAERYGYANFVPPPAGTQANPNLARKVAAWTDDVDYEGYGDSHFRIVQENAAGKTFARAALGFEQILENELVQAKGSAFAAAERSRIHNSGAGVLIRIMHSTGGLVVRGYLKEHPEKHRLSRLIFVSVPHEGSPLANYVHTMWRMRYDRDDALDLQLEAIRQQGTQRRRQVQDGRIWQASRLLEAVQSSLISLMYGDRNAGDADRIRNEIPPSETSLWAKIITDGFGYYPLQTGPNTNIKRDLGVRSDDPLTASYQLVGFNRWGLAPKYAEIGMDVAFPRDHVRLAHPGELGVPYGVVQGISHSGFGLFGGLGPINKVLATHGFLRIGSSGGRRARTHRSYGSAGLEIEGLPEGLRLEDIVSEGSDGIVPAASQTAINAGDTVSIPVEAYHFKISVVAPTRVADEFNAIARAIFNDDPTFDHLYFIPSSRSDPNGAFQMVTRVRDHLFQSARIRRKHSFSTSTGELPAPLYWRG
jgi:pimeloyl-ACP methyl ester carboxylesterase